MSWEEFSTLLSGLGEDTPLARTVMIRLEDDGEVLKRFNSAQLRIRDRWRSKHSRRCPDEKLEAFLAQMQAMFAETCGRRE